ncbi:MAG: hypothetical protein K9K66_15995 [Desulfarculaceae bacterium]|nr:hypothetical protein [Desulfarculaceae bacterium]MCF8073611.1 hypothetical protein [Desulfarculaceae bacterium]MCF8103157.1 hypothetical protein [Desulfarculaceae bacterium]MCF8115673.1 hypothetical protein [Desulfarculaceae bacterium]
MLAVNKSLRIIFTCFGLGLVLASLCFHLGCAKGDAVQFQNKIQGMSDSELLYYYAGINARIKQIGHGMDRNPDAYPYDQKHNIYSTPFSPGKEGYGLIQKRKMILEELQARNIDPSQYPALTLDRAK